MYKAFFNRDPDAGGFIDWIKVLNDGGSRFQLLAGFVNSIEFSQLCQNYGITRGKLK